MSRPSSGPSEHRSALPEGTRLHNYALEQVLGAGGMVVVCTESDKDAVKKHLGECHEIGRIADSEKDVRII